VDIRDLRYFIACAELGQLHRAADRVGRSQPALSKSLARLESELGAKLFHREGRGIRLTSVGETLLAHARRLSHGMQEARRDVAQSARGEIGHVRLGSSPTMAEWLLPGLFARILADAPELTFSVTIGLGDTLRRGLRDGSLDLAVAPVTGGDAPEFTVDRLCEDTVVVAGRQGHKLAGRPVAPAGLVGTKWMLPAEPLASTAWLRRAFQSHNLPPPAVQVEVGAKMLLRGVVGRTNLLTFLSLRDLGDRDGDALVQIQCPELVLQRQFGLLSPANGGYLPSAAVRLAALLRSEATVMLRHPGQAITNAHRLGKRRNLPE
jgi:DNA-binding transcriptional LysR family regulator